MSEWKAIPESQHGGERRRAPQSEDHGRWEYRYPAGPKQTALFAAEAVRPDTPTVRPDKPRRRAAQLLLFPQPVRTPGTRVDWLTAAEWLAGWREIRGRKISSQRYRQERAHLDELLAHRAVIESERDIAVLEQLQAVLKDERPTRGRRDGHPTTQLLCWTNNRLNKLR